MVRQGTSGMGELLGILRDAAETRVPVLARTALLNLAGRDRGDRNAGGGSGGGDPGLAKGQRGQSTFGHGSGHRAHLGDRDPGQCRRHRQFPLCPASRRVDRPCAEVGQHGRQASAGRHLQGRRTVFAKAACARRHDGDTPRQDQGSGRVARRSAGAPTDDGRGHCAGQQDGTHRLGAADPRWDLRPDHRVPGRRSIGG